MADNKQAELEEPTRGHTPAKSPQHAGDSEESGRDDSARDTPTPTLREQVAVPFTASPPSLSEAALGVREELAKWKGDRVEKGKKGRWLTSQGATNFAMLQTATARLLAAVGREERAAEPAQARDERARPDDPTNIQDAFTQLANTLDAALQAVGMHTLGEWHQHTRWLDDETQRLRQRLEEQERQHSHEKALLQDLVAKENNEKADLAQQLQAAKTTIGELSSLSRDERLQRAPDARFSPPPRATTPAAVTAPPPAQTSLGSSHSVSQRGTSADPLALATLRALEQIRLSDHGLPTLPPFSGEREQGPSSLTWLEFFEQFELRHSGHEPHEKAAFLRAYLKGPALARLKTLPDSVDKSDYTAVKRYLLDSVRPLTATAATKHRTELMSMTRPPYQDLATYISHLEAKAWKAYPSDQFPKESRDSALGDVLIRQCRSPFLLNLVSSEMQNAMSMGRSPYEAAKLCILRQEEQSKAANIQFEFGENGKEPKSTGPREYGDATPGKRQDWRRRQWNGGTGKTEKDRGEGATLMAIPEERQRAQPQTFNPQPDSPPQNGTSNANGTAPRFQQNHRQGHFNRGRGSWRTGGPQNQGSRAALVIQQEQERGHMTAEQARAREHIKVFLEEDRKSIAANAKRMRVEQELWAAIQADQDDSPPDDLEAPRQAPSYRSRVAGLATWVLLDSGAAHSLVPLWFVRRVARHDPALIDECFTPPDSHRYTDANGNDIPIYGYLTWKVSVNEREEESVTFAVAGSCLFSVLIGSDVLKGRRRISPAAQQLADYLEGDTASPRKIPPQKLPEAENERAVGPPIESQLATPLAPTHGRRRRCRRRHGQHNPHTSPPQQQPREGKVACERSRIQVAAPQRIPPHTVMAVEVTTTMIHRNPQTLLVSPVYDRDSTGIVEGVTNGDNDKLVVHYRNATPQLVQLEAGAEIGFVETCEVREDWARNWDKRGAEMKGTSSDTSDSRIDLVLNACCIEPTLLPKQRTQLSQLLTEYSSVFAVSDLELTQTHLAAHSLDVGDHRPIKQRQRPIPIGIRDKVRDMLQEMLDRGIIRESRSEWSSPVVIARKKDGSLRFCVDYRAINKVCKQDVYPLPQIDPILHDLNGARFFTTLDLSSGYWQVPLQEDSKNKTAFATLDGLYEFNVLPFGLSTSPACFERIMDSLFRDMIGHGVRVYLDDILISSSEWTDHLAKMREVFERLRAANLKLKPTKCTFATKQTEYLGHVISERGIEVNKAKVDKIVNFPTPRCIKELRSFLGVCNYYRKFVRGFAAIALPLNKLTSSKAAFVWTNKCSEAFDTLKTLLSSPPILSQPNLEAARDGSRPFVLFTDASRRGLGAVLMQEADDSQLHPLYYTSTTLNRSERNYSVSDLEALAVYAALKKLRLFVYGLPIVVRTDHQPLVSMMRTGRDLSPRIQRWATEFQNYHLKFEYVEGKANTVADALSRIPDMEEPAEESHGPEIQAIVPVYDSPSIGVAQQRQRWLTALREDPELNLIMDQLHAKQTGRVRYGSKRRDLADFRMEKDLLLLQTRGTEVKVVPVSLRRSLFDERHKGVFAGHFSAPKILRALQSQYDWPRMSTDVNKWYRECATCSLYNPQYMERPPLQPIEVSAPFELVGMDVVKVGQASSGNVYMLVLVDHFTKWCCAYPITDKRASSVARLIVQEFMGRQGFIPKAFLSDRGGEFVNDTLSEITKLTGVRHLLTVGYKPRENGLAERMNRTLLNGLAKTTEVPMDWDEKLPYLLFAYNTAPHATTGESPYFLLYGRDPPFPSAFDPDVYISPYMVDVSEYRAELVAGLKMVHQMAQQRAAKERENMKRQYDTKNDTQQSTLLPGTRVWCREPLDKGKLEPQFTGPYRVLSMTPHSALIALEGDPSKTQNVQLECLKRVREEVRSDELEPHLGIRRNQRGNDHRIIAHIGIFSVPPPPETPYRIAKFGVGGLETDAFVLSGSSLHPNGCCAHRPPCTLPLEGLLAEMFPHARAKTVIEHLAQTDVAENHARSEEQRRSALQNTVKWDLKQPLTAALYHETLVKFAAVCSIRREELRQLHMVHGRVAKTRDHPRFADRTPTSYGLLLGAAYAHGLNRRFLLGPTVLLGSARTVTHLNRVIPGDSITGITVSALGQAIKGVVLGPSVTTVIIIPTYTDMLTESPAYIAQAYSQLSLELSRQGRRVVLVPPSFAGGNPKAYERTLEAFALNEDIEAAPHVLVITYSPTKPTPTFTLSNTKLLLSEYVEEQTGDLTEAGARLWTKMVKEVLPSDWDTAKWGFHLNSFNTPTTSKRPMEKSRSDGLAPKTKKSKLDHRKSDGDHRKYDRNKQPHTERSASSRLPTARDPSHHPRQYHSHRPH